MTLRKLPDTVYLPTGVTLKPAELREALGGVTRAAVHYWRRHHRFPRSYGTGGGACYLMASDVQEWLERRGVMVKWI